MSEPIKDQIAEAAVTALEGVLVGAGYYTDLGLNVSRRRIDLAEINQTRIPCASVWVGDAEPSPKACAGRYRERVALIVECYVRSEQKADLDRDTIRAEADVKRAVLSTALLGMAGTVTWLAPGPVATDHQEFSDDRLGRRLVAFEVDYNWTAASP